MNKPERIHMIAICGSGMAALAGLLKKAGHDVSGSDQAIYPPMSTLLEKSEIVCKTGFEPEHIDPLTDRVIIGNAVSKDNPEVGETLRRKLPYLSMASALAQFFLQEKQSLVVTGTHGKTTTASLLASVLTFAGADPGALIGGWVKNFDSNHRLGQGPFFVVEGDEYDTAFFDKEPKFLHYRPAHAILTSIEFDHADIFTSLSAIKGHFKNFVGLIPSDGHLLVADGSPDIESVIQSTACHVERYGVELDGVKQKDHCDWWADSIKMGQETLDFEVWHLNKKMGAIQSPLIGRHNLLNTLAVIGLVHHLGLSWKQIQKGIATFQGVKRRQEIVGSVDDILIMDDFAHHPTAISETLKALRLKYPDRRLWVIFEPRSVTSRRNIFQDAFVHAFQHADGIVIANLYAPEKIPAEQRLDPERIVSDLKSRGNTAFFIPTSDQIVSKLAPQLLPGDLICIMSSGGFDGIHEKLLNELRRSFASNKSP
ncbi:UDP-N-acetylmuramate:L-alanyl-gamma-D-glutamyl-meso-diaminopimelate ligase [Nitrospira defluvii]|nr:UDP-N-acetylmuramate:L-alanyl-gamma-D-glutamyl-meso-diaminopimelate ligase [Nitrospira defluvii]